jgi:hypothetical protein
MSWDVPEEREEREVEWDESREECSVWRDDIEESLV